MGTDERGLTPPGSSLTRQPMVESPGDPPAMIVCWAGSVHPKPSSVGVAPVSQSLCRHRTGLL